MCLGLWVICVVAKSTMHIVPSNKVCALINPFRTSPGDHCKDLWQWFSLTICNTLLILLHVIGWEQICQWSMTRRFVKCSPDYTLPRVCVKLCGAIPTMNISFHFWFASFSFKMTRLSILGNGKIILSWHMLWQCINLLSISFLCEQKKFRDVTI